VCGFLKRVAGKIEKQKKKTAEIREFKREVVS